MVDRELLKAARLNLRKNAFVPMTPEAQAAAQAPPMPPGAGGPMPMDPAMMGGMPPPGMPPIPMDPAMMGGGGMPPPMPMDPAMMGGAPPPMPMDPAMMGGAPPPPASDMVQVNMDDLRAMIEEVVGKGENKPAGRVTNAEIMEKLEEIGSMLSQLAGPPPTAEMGMAPEAGGGYPPAAPADLAAMLQSAGMPVQAGARRPGRLAGLVQALREESRK